MKIISYSIIFSVFLLLTSVAFADFDENKRKKVLDFEDGLNVEGLKPQDWNSLRIGQGEKVDKGKQHLYSTQKSYRTFNKKMISNFIYMKAN